MKSNLKTQTKRGELGHHGEKWDGGRGEMGHLFQHLHRYQQKLLLALLCYNISKILS